MIYRDISKYGVTFDLITLALVQTKQLVPTGPMDEHCVSKEFIHIQSNANHGV